MAEEAGPAVNVAEIAVLITAVSGLLLGVWSLVRGLRSDKTTEEKVEAENAHTLFADNLELTKYIDERASLQVTPVRAELAEERELRRRRDSAFGRLLRAIAAQWQGDAGGPDLDPADIAVVEDTIPAAWMRGGGPKRP